MTEIQWIVRHEPSGRYICSTRISVRSSEFARKFNSVRQARIFLRKSVFPKEECRVIEYRAEEHLRFGSDKEIVRFIRYSCFGVYSE